MSIQQGSTSSEEVTAYGSYLEACDLFGFAANQIAELHALKVCNAVGAAQHLS
jgi:hypothetical protein